MFHSLASSHQDVHQAEEESTLLQLASLTCIKGCKKVSRKEREEGGGGEGRAREGGREKEEGGREKEGRGREGRKGEGKVLLV